MHNTGEAHTSSVNSIAWAPPEFGLALVAGSSDGSISLLQYVESRGWELKKQEHAHNIGCNTVSWAGHRDGTLSDAQYVPFLRSFETRPHRNNARWDFPDPEKNQNRQYIVARHDLSPGEEIFLPYDVMLNL